MRPWWLPPRSPSLLRRWSRRGRSPSLRLRPPCWTPLACPPPRWPPPLACPPPRFPAPLLIAPPLAAPPLAAVLAVAESVGTGGSGGRYPPAGVPLACPPRLAAPPAVPLPASRLFSRGPPSRRGLGGCRLFRDRGGRRVACHSRASPPLAPLLLAAHPTAAYLLVDPPLAAIPPSLLRSPQRHLDLHPFLGGLAPFCLRRRRPPRPCSFSLPASRRDVRRRRARDFS